MCEYHWMRTAFNYLSGIPKIFSNRLVLLLMLMSCCCVFLYSWYCHSPLFGRHPPVLQRSANFILSPMNTSVDPCEDFYGFACGSYAQNVSKSSNPLETIHDVMLKNISDFLEMDSSSSDPLILHKARILYKSCVVKNSELYMWWKTINQLLAAYNAIGFEEGPEKNSWCARAVNNILPHATALMLVNRSDILRAKIEVGMMAEDIRNVFNSTISNAPWMNQTVKDTLSGKLMDMKICIGYPPWLEDSEKVDEYHEKYNEVNLTETDFLVNILKLVQTGQRMEKLKEEDSECSFKSLEVNAEYNFVLNELHIQYGFLQLPLYGLVLRALDFGSIGFTIGHELSHGFDYYGMTELLDSFGDNNATKKEYSHRVQCFISDYDSYGEPNATKTDWADEELLRNSDWVTYLKRCASTVGQQTLDENLADINGLKIAFHTYKDQSKKYGSEPLLSYGLEKYTEDQLYFITYANKFCSRNSPSSFTDGWTDEHSPKSIRVWGALRNSEDFAKAWGCKKGSRMNPSADKCEIW